MRRISWERRHHVLALKSAQLRKRHKTVCPQLWNWSFWSTMRQSRSSWTTWTGLVRISPKDCTRRFAIHCIILTRLWNRSSRITGRLILKHLVVCVNLLLMVMYLGVHRCYLCSVPLSKTLSDLLMGDLEDNGEVVVCWCLTPFWFKNLLCLTSMRSIRALHCGLRYCSVWRSMKNLNAKWILPCVRQASCTPTKNLVGIWILNYQNRVKWVKGLEPLLYLKSVGSFFISFSDFSSNLDD